MSKYWYIRVVESFNHVLTWAISPESPSSLIILCFRTSPDRVTQRSNASPWSDGLGISLSISLVESEFDFKLSNRLIVDTTRSAVTSSLINSDIKASITAIWALCNVKILRNQNFLAWNTSIIIRAVYHYKISRNGFYHL